MVSALYVGATDAAQEPDAPEWNTDPEGRFPGYYSLAKAMRLDRTPQEREAWLEDLIRAAHRQREQALTELPVAESDPA